jgi:hypothetical protein
MTVTKTVSASELPHPNALQFPMSPRRTVFKRMSLASGTTISRCRLAKIRSYEFLSGTQGHMKHSSFTIKRKGYFKAYGIANKAYMELCGVIKQVKAQLAELDRSTNRGAGTSKKSTKQKFNVTTAEASQADPALQAEPMSDIKQAQEAADKAKAKGEQAAADMFKLYTKLLSVHAKYAWNKIVHKQTASDP